MAKETPSGTSRTNSAFQKFEALARKLVEVPKSTIGKAKEREKRRPR